MKTFIKNLQQKWNVKRPLDVFLIFAVFTLAGSSMGVIVRPILHRVGMTPATPVWKNICLYLIFVMPFYWVFCLIYGLLLGQFKFFWEREKRIARFIGTLLRKPFRHIAALFRQNEPEYPSVNSK